jgi:pyruvate kinase
VCTIGPASREPAMLESLIRNGMDVARLNFSHGDQDIHGENIRRIRAASEAVGKPVAIMADLQGPKLRVGQMQGEGVPLVEGEQVTLTTRDVIGQPGQIPVQYEHLPETVTPGDSILIDDGLLELVVTGVKGPDITCEVITGGLLTSNKGLNLPHAPLSIPAITEKDWEDLAFALEHPVDWVALSFVRAADEVHTLKACIEEICAFGNSVPVIAKIEKPEALEHIDEIIQAADGIMVARGDLGIETSPEDVPMAQKSLIRRCNLAGVPVITATQMLESMVRNPRPTRAEASDVANAILDGTDAIMLSEETAAGKYPLEALQTMVRIAQKAEQEILREWIDLPHLRPRRGVSTNVTDAVSHATCETACDLQAAAIITATASGATARSISRYRPHVPIIAFTPSPMVQRQLMLSWGVRPLLGERAENTDQMVADAIELAMRAGMLSGGDRVIVTAGVAGNMPGTTNLMRVEVAHRVLARGEAVVAGVITGRARLLPDPESVEPSSIAESDILVVARTDSSLLPHIRRAGGLIVEQGGLDSHAAQLAPGLGIPTLIGVEGALKNISEGQEITLDGGGGVVYEGNARGV